MKKFKCTVTRTDEYLIEFDETKLNDEWMEHYRRYFYDNDTLEEHAEHIAQFRARFGERFIEGYGRPLEDGKKPLFAEDDEIIDAINIIVLSEDEDCEVDVVEQ